jgi:hypothetical protein
MYPRDAHRRSARAITGLAVAIFALAVPALVAAEDFTVPTIPGAGWIQAPDNTAGLSAVIAESPAAGVGDDSVQLTTATASSDLVGIGRVVAGPLSDITGASWQTYTTGDSGLPDAEPASLRFGMFRLGATEFTTMVVERVYNATVTAGTWQTTTLDDSTLVYQTNATGGFCLVDPFTPCTFAAFKAQYPDAVVLGLQVAIGSGIPVTTSYVDGISLTVDGVTDTWDFELAAAPTTAPTDPPTPGATVPPTDFASPATTAQTVDGLPLIILGIVTVLGLSVAMRRSRRGT